MQFQKNQLLVWLSWQNICFEYCFLEYPRYVNVYPLWMTKVHPTSPLASLIKCFLYTTTALYDWDFSVSHNQLNLHCCPCYWWKQGKCINFPEVQPARFHLSSFSQKNLNQQLKQRKLSDYLDIILFCKTHVTFLCHFPFISMHFKWM